MTVLFSGGKVTSYEFIIPLSLLHFSVLVGFRQVVLNKGTQKIQCVISATMATLQSWICVCVCVGDYSLLTSPGNVIVFNEFFSYPLSY